MSVNTYNSPGVYINEIDKSYFETPKSTSITITLLGAAQKGPISTPTILTTVNDFIDTFGEPVDYAGLCATMCLNLASTFKFVRLADTSISSSRSCSLNGQKVTTSTTAVSNAIAFTNAEVGASEEAWTMEVVEAETENSFNLIFKKGDTVVYNSATSDGTTSHGPQGPFNVSDVGFTTKIQDVAAFCEFEAPVITEDNFTYLTTGTYTFSNEAEQKKAVQLPATYVTTIATDIDNIIRVIYNEVGTVNTKEWTLSASDYENQNFRLTLKQGKTNIFNGTVSLDETQPNFIDLLEIPGYTIEVDLGETNFIPNQENIFSTGNNGYPFVDFESVAEGIESVRDREIVPTEILCAPGLTEPDCITQLVDIANTRKDLLLIVDTPQEDTPQQAVEALQNLDTSYVCSYYPWVTIYNSYASSNQIVPPSVPVLVGMMREYLTYPKWTAPAGQPRLDLSEIIGYQTVLTQSLRDILYQGKINPLCNYKNLGHTSMGQVNLQRLHTALDRLNVRMLVNYIKTSVEIISSAYIFTNIEATTFDSWVVEINKFLDSIKTQGGLYDYRVTMSWATVTTEMLNNNIMPGIIQIKPTRVAEYIPIDVVILNKDDEFAK